MTIPVKDPAGYDAAEMIALLEAGARASALGYAAGIHLLTFTALPGSPVFARLVVIEERAGVHAAWVDDWGPLVRFNARVLGGTDRRMLALAASLAAGHRISLLDRLTGEFGWAHARRVAEAVLIRCGAHKFLDLVGTPELAGLQALHSELAGTPVKYGIYIMSGPVSSGLYYLRDM
jgi:hypothetical protein